MATRGEIAICGVLVVGFVAGVAAWEDSKEKKKGEEINNSVEETVREMRQGEFEQRQEEEEERRNPCGEKVEMLDSRGDVYEVCERDVPYNERMGRVRRVAKP